MDAGQHAGRRLSLAEDQIDLGQTVGVLLHAFDNVAIERRTLTLVSRLNGTVTTNLGQELPIDSSGVYYFTPDQKGIYTFRGWARDVNGLEADQQVTLTVKDPSDISAPAAAISSPDGTSVIDQTIDVIGTADDDDIANVSYTLSLRPMGEGSTRTLATGGRVVNGVLGQLDTTSIPNGTYDLRLSVSDGTNTTTVSVAINIEADLKLGNFQISFTDLRVPVSGIPITIGRTYDTQTSGQSSDFGYGWKLDLSTTRVESTQPNGRRVYMNDAFFDGTRVVVTLPDGSREGFTFLPDRPSSYSAYALPHFEPDPGVRSTLSVESHYLYPTADGYLDGETGEAYNPADPLFGGAYALTTRGGLVYRIDADRGTLLSVTDRNGNDLNYSRNGIASSAGRQIAFDRDYAGRILAIRIPDPVTGDLATGPRLQYAYDFQGNLISFTDRTGNTTTFAYRSDAPHILDAINDPLGRPAATTEYDTAGRLYRVTDSDGRQVVFTYDGPRRIQTITDQTDALTQLTLDSAGNVIREVGPAGISTNLVSADPGTRTLTVAGDRVLDFTSSSQAIVARSASISGVYTVVSATYSSASSTTSIVVSEPIASSTVGVATIQPASIVKRTFGARHDLLTETQVIGLEDSPQNAEANDLATRYEYSAPGLVSKVTDEHGQITRTSYNLYGQPIYTADAQGNTTHYFYDAAGNLTQTSDGQRTTVFQYTKAGDLEFVWDRLGTNQESLLVNNDYNSYGDVISTYSGSGHFTEFTYDQNGNQDSVSGHEQENGQNVQVITHTDYDDEGRVIGTNQIERRSSGDTTLWTTQTQYNGAGQVERATKRQPKLGTYSQSGATVTVTLANHGYTTGELADADFTSGLASDGRYTVNITDADHMTITLASSQVTSGNLTLSRILDETVNVYDIRGQLIEARSSTGASGSAPWLIRRTVYDNAGRPIVQTDPYLETTAIADRTASKTIYDDAGRVVETQQLKDIAVTVAGADPNKRSVVDPAHPGTVASHSTTSYDSSGRTVSTTDSFGLVTQYRYNGDGDLIETRSRAFDENDNLVWLVSRTLYDEYGRAVLSTDQYQEGSGNVVYGTRTVYDDRGRAFRTERVRGLVIDIGSDGNTTVTSSGAAVWYTQTTYDSRGQVASTRDANGQVTGYEYDTLGRRTAVLTPAVTMTVNGVSQQVRVRTETYYNSSSQVERQIVKVPKSDGTIDSRETRYEYDAHGNLTKSTFAVGTAAQYTVTAEYDDLGRKTSETTQADINLFLQRKYGYDDHGRLADVWLADPATGIPDTGPHYHYTYDPLGNQATITDPLNHTTAYTFDPRGLELSRELPDGLTETFTYDDRGRQITHTSFEGVLTKFLYDDDENQDGVMDDANGDGIADGGSDLKLKEFYANGASTPADTYTYKHDPFGRETQVIVPGAGGTTTRSFGDEGRLEQIASPQGVINYEYDLLGRPTRTWTAGSAASADPLNDFRYGYDAYGRLGSVSAYERNNSNGSSANTTPVDLDGYSGNGLQPDATGYEYDLLGNLEKVRLPNGIVTDYDYDVLNRLTVETQKGIRWWYGTPYPRDVGRYEYTLRRDGKRTRVVETDYDGWGTPQLPATQTDWIYDKAGRLVEETIDHRDSALDQHQTWSYDLSGNRLTQTIDNGNNATVDETVAYTYDANDRLLTETKDIAGTTTGDTYTTYGYLFPGGGTTQSTQQISKEVRDTSTNNLISLTSYSFNLQGAMSQAVIDSYNAAGTSIDRKETTDYPYDEQGVRIAAVNTVQIDHDSNPSTPLWTQSQENTVYLSDPNNLTGYTQVLEETRRSGTTVGAGTLQERRTHTLGPDQLSQSTSYSDNSFPTYLYWPLTDGLGDTRKLTNQYGDIAQSYQFDAFGNAHGFNPADAYTNQLLADGFWDTRVGMNYNLARWYDPRTGRLTSFDPFGGDGDEPQTLHRYAYVHGDPVNLVDPTGLFGVVELSMNMFTLMRAYGSRLVSAYQVYDKATTIRDAAELLVKFLLTGAIDPIASAILLAQFLPFGSALKYLSFEGRLLKGATKTLNAIYDGAMRNLPIKQAAELVGEVGAGLVAKAKKLVPTNFPRKYHGIDGVLQDGERLIVVEAKGGAAELAETQMSKNWIMDKWERLIASNDPLERDWGFKLRAAAKGGKLQGMVVKTRIDHAIGKVLDPEFELKDWIGIGKDAF